MMMNRDRIGFWVRLVAILLAFFFYRDGEAMRTHLDRWRRGEDRHFAADATASYADLIVDTTDRVYRFRPNGPSARP